MKIGIRGGNLERYLVLVTGNATAMVLILNCFHMWIDADQVIGSENSQVVMAGGGNNNLICRIFVESAGQDG